MPRPRLLLADDHAPFLESVHRLLAPSFDIIGVASHGREALELAADLCPDVVVLDIAMPELNGLQTIGQLRRDCPDAKVVFLTMHNEDDFVVAAVNAGAHGYVLKSRIHLDLIAAINHALAGRLFAPSLTSLSSVAGHGHIVHFHSDNHEYLDEVSELVGATLRSGEQVVMLASEPTRTGVADRLEARQVNLALLTERGQYAAHDSGLALSQMLVDGKPDKRRLAEVADSLNRFRLAGLNGGSGRLTIIGDMSGILCRNGDFETARELEQMWNALTHSLPFFTVCSCSIDSFTLPDGPTDLANLCAEHSGVTSGMFTQRSLEIT